MRSLRQLLIFVPAEKTNLSTALRALSARSAPIALIKKNVRPTHFTNYGILSEMGRVILQACEKLD